MENRNDEARLLLAGAVISTRNDRAELIRALRRLGRRRGVEVRFVTRRGKGSHGTLYWGDRKTIVKDRMKELSRGLLADMVRQLGLDQRDLER